MKRSNLKLFALPVLLFGLIFGCTPEEEHIVPEPKTSQNEIINPFESTFSLENFKEIDGVLPGGLEVDWSSSTQKQMKNGQTLYEFKATPAAPTFLESEVQLPDQFFVLGELDESANAFTWVVKIKPDITAAPIDYSYVNLKDYSGSIIHYDLQGNILRMEGWQKGKGISLVENADEPQPNVPDSMAATCQQRNSLANFGGGDPFDPCPGGGGGSWIPIHTDHYTEWFLVRANGVLEATGNVDYNGRTTEYIWIPSTGTSTFYQSRYDYYSYSLSNGSSAQLSSRPNLVIPYNLINKLTGKANCVFGNLVLSNGNLFAETIGAFINDPEYDLTIQVGNCEGTDEACTDPSDPNNIIITIENVNQSAVGIASLILHEAIHAELWRYIFQYRQGVNPSNKAEVFNYYKHYAELYGDVFNHPDADKDGIDHIYMTQYYINPMAEALRAFDNNQYPLNYYKDFAWDGLRKWAPVGSEENYDPQYLQFRSIVEANSNDCN